MKENNFTKSHKKEKLFKAFEKTSYRKILYALIVHTTTNVTLFNAKLGSIKNTFKLKIQNTNVFQ